MSQTEEIPELSNKKRPAETAELDDVSRETETKQSKPEEPVQPNSPDFDTKFLTQVEDRNFVSCETVEDYDRLFKAALSQKGMQWLEYQIFIHFATMGDCGNERSCDLTLNEMKHLFFVSFVTCDFETVKFNVGEFLDVSAVSEAKELWCEYQRIRGLFIENELDGGAEGENSQVVGYNAQTGRYTVKKCACDGEDSDDY